MKAPLGWSYRTIKPYAKKIKDSRSKISLCIQIYFDTMSAMRNTLKNHKDFAMPETALTAKTAFFIARVRSTWFPDDARYGLIATKRTLKLAVKRNRAKRLLRVWIRENESLLRPDADYVFIARAAIIAADKKNGVRMMKRALKTLK
jgi:ribonuclease P protein component